MHKFKDILSAFDILWCRNYTKYKKPFFLIGLFSKQNANSSAVFTLSFFDFVCQLCEVSQPVIHITVWLLFNFHVDKNVKLFKPLSCIRYYDYWEHLTKSKIINLILHEFSVTLLFKSGLLHIQDT